MRILHCIIFLRTTGCPPRSETPFTISSFANTVPKAGHQLTSVSDKKVRRYFKSIFCCFSDENSRHSAAENTSIESSQAALTWAFPSDSKTEISVSMASALSEVLWYHELNNWIKIH